MNYHSFVESNWHEACTGKRLSGTAEGDGTAGSNEGPDSNAADHEVLMRASSSGFFVGPTGDLLEGMPSRHPHLQRRGS
jgi:hypothetical protein